MRKGCCDLRSGADFSSSWSNADDGGNTPTLVAGFQGLSHNVNVSCGIVCKVATSVGHLDQLVYNALAFGEVLGVDEFG